MRTSVKVLAASTALAAASVLAAPAAQASYSDRLLMRNAFIDNMTKGECYDLKQYSKWDLKVTARQYWWNYGRDDYHWAYGISRGEFVGGFLWAVRDCY